MMVERKTNPALYVSALAGVLALFVFSGCESSPSAEDAATPETSQADADSAVMVETPAENDAASETQATPDPRVKKAKKAETDVAVNTGPGEGPPPAAETKSKVEEMERSLAPLEAVPATPPS